MAKSDWAEIVLQAPTQDLSGFLWRIVESQEDIATLDLVDTLAEQSLLEELLDNSKPNLPEVAQELDYLLSTPFRYPPLQWGSRFGSTDEASLYYGTMSPETAFAELAYYRFVFLSGMDDALPNNTITTNHTLFSAEYLIDPGIDLRGDPFAEYSKIIQHKSNYGPTQNLGSAMRDAEMQGFYFTSTRCPEKGTNVALFTPEALVSRKPVEQRKCYCETSAEHVFIKQGFDVHFFPLEIFLVDGDLPLPA